ncbi:DegT/DnrJ/EryC1/StrS family aminotransferase [Micromonospora sp. NPDC050397]|uniref:DegT/DnrJ/EryC1/StrS family aminotransferase n=1 Tax=Micromonospora sp. NPDC050397 TaxID=3364279 RepID=UPI00384B9D16
MSRSWQSAYRYEDHHQAAVLELRFAVRTAIARVAADQVIAEAAARRRTDMWGVRRSVATPNSALSSGDRQPGLRADTARLVRPPTTYATGSTCPAVIAAELAASGLPPDSVRYGYRPLHRQPLFRAYATDCPNAEVLAATTLQLPCHPGTASETIEWVARRTAAIARRET